MQNTHDHLYLAVARSATMKTRPTIGYVTPGIHDPVGNQLWQGIVDAAQQYDLNLICITGGRLHDDSDFLAQGNILYELLGAEHVDGVILWALSLYELSNRAEVADFHRRYDPVPMVTIAHPIDDHPMVGVDNAPGIRELMEHLVSDHHYRRIAFMRGPDTHPYAEERYRVYCEVLSAHQIPVDPLLVSQPGTWSDDTARQALHLLFDERHLRPGVDVEAIVAVNENFALVAIQTLRERGMRIPHDVAVVGIHSAPQGRYATPPLTTVTIPTYERGYTAVEVLLKCMQGQAVPTRVILPAKMIVRQSCGCLDPLVSRAKAGLPPPHFERAAEATFEDQHNTISDALTGIGLDRALAEQTREAFSSDVHGATAGAFLPILEDNLAQIVDAERLMAVWQDVVSVLRQDALSWLKGKAARDRLEDLVNQARVLIGDAARLAEARQRIQAEQQTATLHSLSRALATTFDISGLMEVLATHLPRVGISACYLAVYESPQPYRYPQPAPEWSRLLLAYADGVRVPLEAGGKRFPTRQIVPEGLLMSERRYALVVEPLHFQKEQIGFILLHAGLRDGALYQVLSNEISSAIQGALLVQRIQERSAELTRQQYILDTFMENVPDYIYFKNLESHFTRANKAHARKLGLSDPSEEIGKSDFDFFMEEQARIRYKQEQEIIRTGQPILNLEEHDGHGQWALTTKMPLRDEKGNIIGTFGISRDITQLKQAQAALESAYADIEQQIEERTAELQHEIAERKHAEAERETLIAELEARNAELERFLYTVSHDLRSPLITMGGFIGFLEKDALAGNIERLQADAAHINDALARMRQLLDELLELSRIGRLTSPPEVIPFEAIAREAVALVRQSIEARGVNVVILPDLPAVSGDRARLVEVVQNLIDNACKFMGEQPHPQIEIGARQTEDKTVFYVRDNGIGIDPRYHEQIFGLFDKLDPTSAGIGIGLALVKRIVEIHGGSVWIESEVGAGSTFCFTLA